MADNDIGLEYRNFKGVNNIDNSYRLQKAEDGVFLKEGVNIDIDKTGQITTREGTSIIWSYPTRSLYTNGRDTLGVVSGNLVYIYPENNWATSVLVSNVGSNPWYYVTVGDRIYCTNAEMIGYVKGREWNGFATPTDKYKRKFPPCKHIEYFNGRIYGALNNVVIMSDPIWYEVIDERNDKSYIEFGSTILMVKAVGDGIWIGDESGLIFLKGSSPSEFEFVPVSDAIVKEGSDVYAINYLFRGELWPNIVWVTTSNGICVLGDGGKYVPLTDKTYSMPTASRGTAYIKRGRINQYVSIIK